jgi:hypothetical protein
MKPVHARIVRLRLLCTGFIHDAPLTHLLP